MKIEKMIMIALFFIAVVFGVSYVIYGEVNNLCSPLKEFLGVCKI